MPTYLDTYRTRLATMVGFGWRPMVKLTLPSSLRCGCGPDAYVVQRAAHVDVTVCRECWRVSAIAQGKPNAAELRP